MVSSHWTMGNLKISEWLWRFLASVMLFAVGWSVWIFYQINPPALITDAAFEAAARANAKQNAQGRIAQPVASEAPKEPPINADKLKFSDTLSETK
jgi:hypothetical protein